MPTTSNLTEVPAASRWRRTSTYASSRSVRGDATQTLQAYLAEHPETIVALAYFDFDIYEPTRVCLELVRERLTKGSILAFDELNCTDFPGETVAVREVLGLDRYAIQRLPYGPGMPCFLVVE